MIRTLGVAAALAGAILLAPVAQAKPVNTTGPDRSHSVANAAALSRGPAVGSAANKFAPTITATPFGSTGTFARQPGLAIANANGNAVAPTGIPVGSATPMAQGNMVLPAATTTSLSGGTRTRHGFAAEARHRSGL